MEHHPTESMKCHPNDIPDLDSALSKKALSLTQRCQGQRSAWISAITNIFVIDHK